MNRLRHRIRSLATVGQSWRGAIGQTRAPRGHTTGHTLLGMPGLKAAAAVGVTAALFVPLMLFGGSALARTNGAAASQYQYQSTGPVAAITFSPPSPVTPGTSVQLGCGSSTDDSGAITSCAWTVDGSSVGSGDLTQPVSWTAPWGSHSVGLTVTDNQATPARASTSATLVSDTNPNASAGGPYSYDLGSGGTLSLSGTAGDADIPSGDSLTSYSWSIDATVVDSGTVSTQPADGSSTVTLAKTLTQQDVALLGLADGTHTVSLLVNDSVRGSTTATASLSVTGTAPSTSTLSVHVGVNDVTLFKLGANSQTSESVSATQSLSGALVWDPYIFNLGTTAVTQPTISLSLATNNPPTLSPPISNPDSEGPGSPLGQYQSFWMNGLDGGPGHSSSPLTAATGFDATRTFDTTTIPSGGGDETVTITITPSNSAPTGSPYVNFDASMLSGATITAIQAPGDPNGSTDAAIDQSSGSTKASWSLQGANGQAGTTYTVAATIHVPNSGTSSIDVKPRVQVGIQEPPVALGSGATGPSTTIDDPTIGTFTFSVGNTDAQWTARYRLPAVELDFASLNGSGGGGGGGGTGNALGFVSCPSASFCAADDDVGNVATSTNPTGGASAWTVTNVDGSNTLHVISCASASFCAAVDTVGNVVTSTNPTGGASAWTVANVDGSNRLDGISCPSASLCVADDGAGNVLTSTNPTGGASTWTGTNIDGSNILTGISCPSSLLCVAVGPDGSGTDIVSSTDPAGGASAWTVTTLAGSFAADNVSCPSTSLCVAVGGLASGGQVATSTDPTGGASTWITATLPTDIELGSVSCPSSSLCVAVDGHDDIATSSDPTGGASAWTITNIGSVDSSGLDSVSCPSTSLCVATDDAGNVITSTDPTGGASAWTPASVDQGGGGGGGGQSYDVTGTVQSPTGGPVSVGSNQWIQIDVVAVDGQPVQPGQMPGTTTATDGTFNLQLATGYTYTLRATPNGLDYHWVAGTASIDLQKNQTVTGLKLTLRAANVTGTVTSPTGGALQLTRTESIQINVLDSNGNYLQGMPSTQTDANGNFGLQLPNGSYLIQAWPSGLSDPTWLANTTPISLTTSSPSATANIELEQANVTGHVYEPTTTPTPVANDQVNVFDSQGMGIPGIWGTQTDSNGFYALRLPCSAPPCTFELEAGGVPPSYAAHRISVTLTSTSQSLTGQDITLETANVSGTVYAPDAAHTPVGNVSIDIVDASGNQVGNAQANDSGQYAVKLPDGAYTLRAQGSNGYGTGTLTVSVIGGVASGTNQDITLTTPNVSGHVIDPTTGQPITSGTYIDVLDQDGNWIPNGPPGVSTDQNGTYSLTLPPGTWTLRAEPPYGSSLTFGTTVVTVKSGGAAKTGIDITLTTANVSGHVTAGGSDVSTGIEVETPDGSFSNISGTTSGLDGSYSLRLPPGTWILAASPTGAYAGGSTEVTIDASGTLTSGSPDIVLSAANLIVHVENSDASNAANAWVTVANSAQPEQPIAQASTDQNGIANFSLPNGQSYVVVAQPPGGPGGNSAQSLPWAVSIDANGVVSDKNGTHADHTVLVSLQQPNVTGQVVDGSGPVANAWVSVNAGADQFSGAPVASTSTDSNGNFAVALGDGTYTISVQPPPSTSDGAPAPITFSVVGSKDLGKIVLPAANVSGTVVLPDRTTKVENASVSIHTVDWSKSVWTMTDSNGEFHATLPDPGDYIVEVNPPQDSTYGAGRGTVTVNDDGTTTPPTLTIALTNANVTGTVVSPSGNPVANASVNAHNDDYSFQTSAQTDSTGTFRLTVPSELYGEAITLEAEPQPGSTLGPGKATVTVSQGQTATATVTLTNTNLTGRVYYGQKSTKMLAAGAQVQIRSDDNSFFAFAQTDSNGVFRATLPASGTYEAQAMPPPGTSTYAQSPLVQITVDAFGTVTSPASVDLVLGAPELTGTVVDGQGKAVANASIQVHTADFSQQSFAQSDGNGVFSIGGLPAVDGQGNAIDYIVEAFPPPSRSDLLPVQVGNTRANPPQPAFTIPNDPTQWPVTVSNATVAGNAVLQFTGATDTLKVTILDANNNPITSGAYVSAFQDGGSGQFTQSSGGDNYYTLHVSDGVWRVMVNSSSASSSWVYTGQPVSVVIPGGAGCSGNVGAATCTVTINVTSAGATVTGTVLKPDGVTPAPSGSAWVDVRTPNGIGNGGQVGSGGTFSVKVPPGKYTVSVYPNDSQLGSPQPVSVNATAAQPYPVGNLVLVQRSSQIQGKVAYASGTALSGVQVFAFQPDGGGFAQATTQADGSYTLRVTAGTWDVGTAPGPSDTWLYNGQPLSVAVTAGSTSSGNDFTVTPSAATLTGRVVDSTGALFASDGYVFAENSSTQAGTPVNGGTFSLPLSPGTYTVNLFLPPGSPYSPPDAQQVIVNADGTLNPSTLTFTLRQAGNTIQGLLVDASHTPLLNKNVEIDATNGNGGFVSTEVAPNGSFSLNVGKGTWQLAADFPDGDLTFVTWTDHVSQTQEPGSATFSSDSGGANSFDLVTDAADSQITGTVYQSDGTTPVPFAFVYANTPDNAALPLHVGVAADANGQFALQVPPGTYNVGAQSTVSGELAPTETRVTVDSTHPATVNPQFRAVTVTVNGTVSAAAAGLGVTVQAWSDGGASTTQKATDAGGGTYTYSLTLTPNDTWHLKAGAVEGTQAYTSAGVALTTPANGTVSAPAITLSAATVSASQTVTFDASQPAVVHFGNLTLTIPAGALAASGNVSITASPIPAPSTSSTSYPIGIGYTLIAVDSSGTQIKSFKAAIRVTYPYDPVQVAALGLDPTQLVPSYLDPATNSYRKVDGVTVDTTAHTFSFSTTHFTDFVVVATQLAAPTVTSVSPGSATTGAGSTITVSGTGFQSGAAVRIGSLSATGVTVVSPSELTATIPTSLAASTYDITVENTDGRSGSKTKALTLSVPASSSGSSGSSSSSGSPAASSPSSSSSSSSSSSPAAPTTKQTDLGVEATSNVTATKVGDTVFYTITVSQISGVAASGVTLTDVLPDGVQLVSAVSDHGSHSCTGSSSTLTCFLDTIGVGDKATVQIVVRVLQPGPLSDRASVSQNETDTNSTNDSSSVTVTATAVQTGRTKAPAVTIGGALRPAQIVATHSATASIVHTTVRTQKGATVTVTLLGVVRVHGRLVRRPILLPKGSRIGPVIAKKAQATLAFRARNTRALPLRVALPRSLRLKVAYLRVTVTAHGRSKTVLVRVKL